jgi:hypothetical protein
VVNGGASQPRSTCSLSLRDVPISRHIQRELYNDWQFYEGVIQLKGNLLPGGEVGDRQLRITVYPLISVPLSRGGSFQVKTLVGDGL